MSSQDTKDTRKIIHRAVMVLYETDANGDDLERVEEALKSIGCFDRKSPEKAFLGNLTRMIGEIKDEVRGERATLARNDCYLVMRK